MEITNLALPRTVPPMLAQHAQDAAFYWSLRDTSEQAQHITLAKLAEMESIMNAHLDGLLVAGAAGMATAETALERWRGAGEMFVCFYLAAAGQQHSSAEKLLAQVENRPDTLLRGLISALASLPAAVAAHWISHCSKPDSSAVQQVAALRACALLGISPLGALPSSTAPSHIALHFASPSPFVRAAACRALANLNPTANLSDGLRMLQGALIDAELIVRAEAAIAIANYGQPQPTELWQCVSTQALVHEQATGWYRKQAQRRLLRWTRHLACQVAHGNSHIPQLLERLPARLALCFVLHHADPHYLPFVLDKLEHSDTRRYAAWVWQSMTGCDVLAHGLTLEDEVQTSDSTQLFNQEQIDASNGMPRPNPQAIRAHPATYPRQGKILLGQPMSTNHALHMLETAPQALRAIAATHLAYGYPTDKVTVRASVAVQRRSIANLRAHTSPKNV